MPYSIRKNKDGSIIATNKITGKKRRFKNQKAYTRWKRIAEATKHGFKPI